MQFLIDVAAGLLLVVSLFVGFGMGLKSIVQDCNQLHRFDYYGSQYQCSLVEETKEL